MTAMAGYSGTPLAKKLGIKPGHRVALVGAPQGFAAELQPLPEDVLILARPRANVDVIVLFTPSMRLLQQKFQRCVDLRFVVRLADRAQWRCDVTGP